MKLAATGLQTLWKLILWSEELRFIIRQADGWIWATRTLLLTVMGNVNASVYKDVLDNGMLGGSGLGRARSFFSVTRHFCTNKVFKELKCPAPSPDHSPTGHR